MFGSGARSSDLLRNDGGPKAWFFKLFGFHEKNYESTIERLQADDEAGTTKSVSAVDKPANGKTYRMGHFETPSLAELQARRAPANGSGRLVLRTVVDDVTQLLKDPENRHATFQVASQFNCLEFASPNVTPEEGISKDTNE